MTARRVLALALPVAALVGLAVGYARSCSGPRPTVAAARFEPLLAGGVRAVATIRNAGGEGQVEVVFRLVDAHGRTFTKEESSEIRRGEEIEVSTWIGAPLGDWRLEVEVEYPPR